MNCADRAKRIARERIYVTDQDPDGDFSVRARCGFGFVDLGAYSSAVRAEARRTLILRVVDQIIDEATR